MNRVALMLLSAALLHAGAAESAELTVRLDARDVVRRRLHTDLTLAVKPGPLTLVFPKWIPGEHGPTGQLDTIIGLVIRAGGRPLEWRRDPLDMYAIALTVPAEADRLEIALETGLPSAVTGFSSARTATAQLAVLPWNMFVLLPKGRDADTIETVASVVPPPAWSAACALPSRPLPGGGLEMGPVSLARLVDSPVQIGRFTKRVEIAGSAPGAELPHVIAIAADSAAALALPDGFASGYSRLVAEAGALFGSRPYRRYTWLATFSDHVAHFGLEHHESSDDRMGESTLGDPLLRKDLAGLLGHEYVHSWNGKHRRPEGLLSPDYEKPMDGSLLWVYEGMTQFWGDVLATRAGLLTPQDTRELLATSAGHFDVVVGPRWRPLADTAVQAQVLYGSPEAWESARRTVDFYDAAVYLWLDVDAEIRARTKGRASLDDFARRFFAGPSGQLALRSYVEQEVYDTLAAIAPGEWRALVRRHLDPTGTAALTGALERSGRKLSAEVLDAAIREAKGSDKPIEVLVEDGDFYRMLSVAYSDGPRFPHLTRVDDRPDLLSQVLAPRSK